MPARWSLAVVHFQEVHAMTQRILLMSSSRKDQLGYLEHASEQIHMLLKHEPRKVLFVPFAAVTFSFDSYEDLVKPAFERLGYALESIHRSDDPLAAIEQAEAIAIGGGNTFALLKRLYDAGIADAIRASPSRGATLVCSSGAESAGRPAEDAEWGPGCRRSIDSNILPAHRRS